MSVAFRRESDEEHLEPKFEVPIPPGPNLVTAQGLVRIRARIAELESELPTLTEDADRNSAKRDLRYWRARLATAQVQPAPTGELVAFGCQVRFVLAGKHRTIEIVGHDEAEPARDRLAFTAPLARAMMDAQVGEFVDFNGKEEAIEIVSIAPLNAE
ncbi:MULTISPECIES: GreA/GreB family elongation factor [Novosphingobium]|uniref:Transcription elongation factor, GreA/GreB family n=1 Tax=Novosphingobium mathurense TaxID=428990 RepID=A0A1U6GYQ8_9SPHN|nr:MULTISPECIES: GreA/GreB family elongation factor [Novosphingobium]CDO38232.1 GreA/GreB family elongation factor [Novosphingobium sp. KN65.2]SLJ88664.1 Transcription elongation factor, GreA/GreB family [Novosphingobium mathurense]